AVQLAQPRRRRPQLDALLRARPDEPVRTLTPSQDRSSFLSSLFWSWQFGAQRAGAGQGREIFPRPFCDSRTTKRPGKYLAPLHAPAGKPQVAFRTKQRKEERSCEGVRVPSGVGEPQVGGGAALDGAKGRERG